MFGVEVENPRNHDAKGPNAGNMRPVKQLLVPVPFNLHLHNKLLPLFIVGTAIPQPAVQVALCVSDVRKVRLVLFAYSETVDFEERVAAAVYSPAVVCERG
jgi:hypothetical protein